MDIDYAAEAQSLRTEADANPEEWTRAELLADAQTLALLGVLQEVKEMRKDIHILRRKKF